MKGWVKTTLGALVQDGSASYQTGPFGTALKASEYSPDGVPLISVGEIREGYLQVHSTTPRVNKVVLDRLPKYILRKDDIVFGRKGAIDRNAIINEHQDGWFLGSDGIRLRLSGDHNSLYFSYLLRSRSIGQWLMQNSQGAIMPTLNQSILDRLPVSIPDLKTQEKIAAVLSALDAKIALNQRINVELEGMAKLLYDYWFVQYDFPLSAAQAAALGKPHLAGKPYRSSGGPMVYHNHLKREIPAIWKVGSLGEIANNVRDGIDPKDVDQETPYVGLEHIERQNFSLWRWGISSDVDSQKSKFKKGDFLFGKLRPYFHKVCQTPFDGICSTDILVIRAKGKKYQNLVGCQIFESDFVEYTTKHSSGTQMPRANWSAMAEYKITIPDDQTLEAFNQLIQPLAFKCDNSVLQNQELTTLRDWLLPMLMNGQVRVTG